MSILSGDNPFYLVEKKKGYKNLEGKKRGNLYSHVYDYTNDHNDHVIYTIHVAPRGGKVERVYVGKAKNGIKRPTTAYQKGIENFENKVTRKSYKKDKDGNAYVAGERDSWRKHIHPPLSQAKKDGMIISLTLVNPGSKTVEELNVAERAAMTAAIKKYGRDKVLNKADVTSIMKELDAEFDMESKK